MDRDDPLLHQLCGKVAALELLMEFVVRDWAMRGDPADPVSELERIRKGMRATLQFVGFQEDEFGEKVWNETVSALERMLENAREQLEGQMRRR